MGMKDHVLQWEDVTLDKNELLDLINGKEIPEQYVDIADDLAKFRGMPFDEIVKYLKMTDLPDGITDEKAAEMNDSAEILFSYFPNAHEFLESRGAFGTDQSWGELINGREMKSLFSYANVWNEFRIESFMGRVSNTFSNLLFGGRGDSWFDTDPENMHIRRQTIITFGIMVCFAFPAMLHTMKMTKKLLRTKEQKQLDRELEEKKNGYYDERRQKNGAEHFLDIFETMQVAFLLFTTMVEFVGFTIVVGSDKSYESFVSESYSTNWYYLLTLLTVSHVQPAIRKMFGTETRHPDSFDISTPAKVAFELSMVAITTENVDDVLHEMLGTGGSSDYGNFISKLAMGLFAVKQTWRLGKFVKNYLKSDSEVLSNMIETHASMIKDPKKKHIAKHLRNKLFHNKTFRRAAMKHMSTI
jgi:hypothetical protein